MEVVVEFDYVALHDDELTLRLGDIIKNVRYIEEDGWMEGDLNGKRGLFPDNFVKELKKDPKDGSQTTDEPKDAQPQKREKVGNVAGLVQRISVLGIPTGAFQPPVPPASKKPKKRQCKVLYEYQPQNEDELELKVGDIVDINEEVEEGWWNGTSNGKSGLFPSNFVKELDPMGDVGESNDARADETDGSGVDSAGTPVSPLPPSGNGVIAQPKKIKGIGFGDIFKDASYKKKPPVQTPDKEEKNENPIPSIPPAAKPALPNTTDSQKVVGDSKSKAKEYCKVAFTYKATNEDELTLNEGDIVHILSKDTGEPGWWRGEVGGEEGVFPDNFVVMISEAEKEAPVSRGSLKSSPKPESEEKPKKPPPPSKSAALKPEIPSADKKPHLTRPEDRVDKPTPDLKPKPAAPVVPPKKPVPPPGKGRPGTIPPKRPDKPLAPSPSIKHNGEVPSTRPKSESEPLFPTKLAPLPAGDSGEKSDAGMSHTYLMTFDDLSSTSEKLSHLTTNRPKMPGRRLPTQFGGGHSPNKEVSVEKSFKIDEEDAAKPKLTEAVKPSTFSQSPLLHKPAEAKPAPTATPSSDAGASVSSKARVEPEEPSFQLEELRSQMKELQLTVDLIKSQQMKEIAELRGELDEERQKRVSLQMEIEKLKRTIHST
ncbi:CD2-associated protein isoform X2 [Archocentrus centrarchus]|uniref:CD2-associated protein isoform X2 n=1 Tax=Archocentrus centrarchus TaxID=63155 RepID=UPI0011EA2837|nr:CD2-associated protein isoform X2 [Archocentrus centrarchus]